MSPEEVFDYLKSSENKLRVGGGGEDIHPGDIIFQGDEKIPLGVVLETSDNDAVIFLGGSRPISVSKTDLDINPIPSCDSCSKDKTYHDGLEEWVCPFCDL